MPLHEGDAIRGKSLVGIDFRTPFAQQGVGVVVHDAKDPRRKTGNILEFFQIRVWLPPAGLPMSAIRQPVCPGFGVSDSSGRNRASEPGRDGA
jgi:hypothetical protein